MSLGCFDNKIAFLNMLMANSMKTAINVVVVLKKISTIRRNIELIILAFLKSISLL